jgi:hypothetical protein
MSYDIHIRRTDRDINLEEWQSAVRQTSGVRLISGDVPLGTTLQGQAITVKSSGGDAELFQPDVDRWVPAFQWRSSDGEAVFAARGDFDDRSSPIRTAARQLASILSAQLVGDEGEVYE